VKPQLERTAAAALPLAEAVATPPPHLIAKSTASSPSACLDMHGLCRGWECAFTTASSTSAPNPDVTHGRRTGSDNHDLAASISPSPWRRQHR